MRKAIVFLLGILICAAAETAAQDIIITVDAERIEAVVSEIGEDYVLYKTFDNQNGPDYRISASKVMKIRFANGTEKIFNDGSAKADDLLASAAVVPGSLLIYRNGRYYVGPHIITSGELIDYIGYTTYGSTYIKAKRQYLTGMILTTLGAGLLATGIISHISSVDTRNFFDNVPGGISGPDVSGSMTYVAVVCDIVGAGSLAAGIPILVKANRKLEAIADDYNRRYVQYPSKPGRSLTIGGCRSGLGLAFNF